MKNLKLILGCTILFLSPKTFALGPLYVDLRATAGTGKAAVENEAESPSVMQYGVGTTVGFKLLMFFLGVSADYYKVAQTTEPNTSFGNRGGSRTNLLSPTLGFNLLGLNIKADYQFSGSYELEKKTSSGETLSYEKPTGYRIYAGYNFTRGFEVGAFYENVAYGEEHRNSVKTKLDDKLEVSQVGLSFAILL